MGGWTEVLCSANVLDGRSNGRTYTVSTSALHLLRVFLLLQQRGSPYGQSPPIRRRPFLPVPAEAKPYT